ncbi:MAG: bifunctional UDP-3-O-[3-hydroxymyristoyl] N-acetylglucosamine deacetylase/3-hydroxyacyl-ACP dehydratase [Schleiferiaceae bacterium]
MIQYTLNQEFSAKGRGIHSGSACHVVVKPGQPGSGYVLVRSDLDGQPSMPLRPELVSETDRCTTLSDGETTVHTAEHLLSALFGLGVLDAEIHSSAAELPILDGSAQPWVEAIQAAGLSPAGPLRGYRLRQTVRVEDPETGSWAEAVPAALPHYRVALSHEAEAIGPCTAEFQFGGDYAQRVAPARTFTLVSHLLPMIHRGLLQGAEEGSGIVILDRALEDSDWTALEQFIQQPLERTAQLGALPLTPLRMPAEPAAHKLLDVLGDLALIGRPVAAEIRIFKPGHRINTLLAQRIMEHLDAANPVPFFDPNEAPLMDATKIMSILPHRPPFMLVDRIHSMTENDIWGSKAVTMNEPFFPGHFPGAPVMPGVLQLEAMAQVGGILALSTVPDPENYLTYFLKMDEVKFKSKVTPGDTLYFHLTLTQPIRRGIVVMRGEAYVGQKLITEGLFTAMITKDK